MTIVKFERLQRYYVSSHLPVSLLEHSFSPNWLLTPFVVQTGYKFEIFLFLPLKPCNYKCVVLYQTCFFFKKCPLGLKRCRGSSFES